MKIFLLSLTLVVLFLFSVLNNSVAQVNVTFRVNMQQQVVSDSGVHIAGNFYDIDGDLNPENPGLVNWNPDSLTLTDLDADNIYEVTLQLIPATYQFKFINGNAWGTDESIPVTCAVGGNREVMINPIDTILPAYCFASCDPCAAPPVIDSVLVTFKVNMLNQTISGSGVHLAGIFNNWNTSSIPMISVGPTNYQITLLLPKDSVYQYKFVNGNTSDDYEILSSNFCTDISGQNRQLTLGNADTVLLNVCFNSCYTCTVVSTVNITFRVDMSQVATISPNGVHLAGNFQNWDAALTPMVDMGSNIYEVTFSMNPNQIIEYKFINGNAWGSDEVVPASCANSSNNRELTIYNFDFTLGLVCYGQCGVCVPPVVGDSVNVTFQVDMQQQTVSDSGVHIAGVFQNWDPASSLMNNVSGSIYAKTFKIPVNTIYEYKFVNGNAWGTDESVPVGCAQNNNRYVSIANTDTTIALVCYGSCSACPIISTDSINMTFNVDLQGLSVSPNGIHLAGNFQNWNPATTPMNNIGGSTYSVTLFLPTNTYLEYKFVNGNAWGTDEAVPGSCALNQNRFITTPTSDYNIPLVCFSSCTICAPGNVVNVTFQVDMGGIGVSPNGVHIMGDFQGWDPAATSMVNLIGSLYQYTLALAGGTTIQYKYVNGNDSASAEIVPANCAYSTSLNNRFLLVPAVNTLLPKICFASCTTCVVGINETENNSTVKIFPSVTSGELNIINHSGSNLTINIFDAEGKFISKEIINSVSNKINLGSLASGVYHLQIMNDKIMMNQKIILMGN